MLDDADRDAPEFDPPDADEVYARYLETCKRLGVEPVPRERAGGLKEWSDALAGCRNSAARRASHGESSVFGIYHYAAYTACHEHPE